MVRKLNEIVCENIIGVLLGNKSDLNNSRVISYEEGEILGKNIILNFLKLVVLMEILLMMLFIISFMRL